MKWHLIFMIIWSLLYIIWKIYLYSRSIIISYGKPSTGKMCDFMRWIKRIKYYVKDYFQWYGIKHSKTVILVWLIYGGFYIW
jgi:hypothetical protein